MISKVRRCIAARVELSRLRQLNHLAQGYMDESGYVDTACGIRAHQTGAAPGDRPVTVDALAAVVLGDAGRAPIENWLTCPRCRSLLSSVVRS